MSVLVAMAIEQTKYLWVFFQIIDSTLFGLLVFYSLYKREMIFLLAVHNILCNVCQCRSIIEKQQLRIL